MKKEFEFNDLFDADLANAQFVKIERAKVRVSSLIELAKMPQVKTNQ